MTLLRYGGTSAPPRPAPPLSPPPHLPQQAVTFCTNNLSERGWGYDEEIKCVVGKGVGYVKERGEKTVQVVYFCNVSPNIWAVPLPRHQLFVAVVRSAAAVLSDR